MNIVDSNIYIRKEKSQINDLTVLEGRNGTANQTQGETIK